MKSTLFIHFFNVVAIITISGMDFNKESDLDLYRSNQSSSESIVNNTETYEQFLADINTALNKAIPNGLFFQKAPNELTEKEHLNLIHIVESSINSNNNINISDRLITDLMGKNGYFRASVYHFITQAMNNFNKVTCNTIDTVVSSKNQQPTPQLNQLFPILKKYVMQSASDRIECFYTMYFTGHTNNINSLHIQPQAQIAASASSDGTFKVWSLAEGKELYTLPEVARDGKVQFNEDGSLLATATYQPIGQIGNIAIWKITSQKPEQPLYTISYYRDIANIAFFKNCLAVYGDIGMSLYKLKKNTTVAFLNHNSTCCKSVRNIEVESHTKANEYFWRYTKRAPLLYLAQKAIDNTLLSTSLPSITKTDTYKQLTPYEQKMLKDHALRTRNITF